MRLPTSQTVQTSYEDPTEVQMCVVDSLHKAAYVGLSHGGAQIKPKQAQQCTNKGLSRINKHAKTHLPRQQTKFF